MLILASRSPRRQELLRAAGIEFRAVAPTHEEPSAGGTRRRFADLVRRTALRKAASVAAREEDIVLGADTIVVCEGRILGKPGGEDDARRMLRMLSDRWHSVYTGVALLGGGARVADYERTEVSFRKLSKRDITWYVGTGEPMDKAGAYAIQGKGGALVRAVRGCFTNVIGLPLPKLMDMLADFRQHSFGVRAALRGVRSCGCGGDCGLDTPRTSASTSARRTP